MTGCPFLPVFPVVPSGRLGTRSVAFHRWLPGAPAARNEAMCSGGSAARPRARRLPPAGKGRFRRRALRSLESVPSHSSIRRIKPRSRRGCSDRVSGRVSPRPGQSRGGGSSRFPRPRDTRGAALPAAPLAIFTVGGAARAPHLRATATKLFFFPPHQLSLSPTLAAGARRGDSSSRGVCGRRALSARTKDGGRGARGCRAGGAARYRAQPNRCAGPVVSAPRLLAPRGRRAGPGPVPARRPANGGTRERAGRGARWAGRALPGAQSRLRRGRRAERRQCWCCCWGLRRGQPGGRGAMATLR